MDVHVRGPPRSATSLVNTLLTQNLPSDKFNVIGGDRHNLIPDDGLDGYVVQCVKHPFAWIASYRVQAGLPHGTSDYSDTLGQGLALWWQHHHRDLYRHSDRVVRHQDILYPEDQAGWVNRFRTEMGLDTLEDPWTPPEHVNDARGRWNSIEEMRAYYEQESWRGDVDVNRLRTVFTDDAARELLDNLGLDVNE